MKEIRLGLAFFVAVILLVMSSLMIRRFSTAKVHAARVQFKNAAGLRVKDQIQVLGVDAGFVGEVKRHGMVVNVMLCLDEPLVFKSDYNISIKDSSALGGSYVAINPGSSEQTVYRSWPQHDPEPSGNGKLEGQTTSLFISLERLIEKNQKPLEEAINGLKEIIDDVRTGKGLLGKLVTHDEIYVEFKKIAENTRELTESLKNGDGLAGRLIQDTQLADDLTAIVRDLKAGVAELRKTAEHLNAGEGTLGKLLTDSSAHDELMKVMKSINEGPGTVHTLLKDEEVANDLKVLIKDLRTSIASLKTFSGDLEKGNGLLNRIVTDEKMADDAQQAISDVKKFVGKIDKVRTWIGVNHFVFAKQKLGLTQLYVRVEPNDRKFYHVGASFLSLDKNGPIVFDKQIEDQDDDVLIKPTVQLGYRFPEVTGRHLAFRVGLLEGAVGGGIDYDWRVFGNPARFTLEGRDGFNDLKDDDLDENIPGAMVRFYSSVRIWNRLSLYVGASNLLDDPEFSGGIGFEYNDQDIKTLVGFVGLGQ